MLCFMAVSILESLWLFAFMCIKVLVLYLYTKEGYDIFHLKQLVKLFLLCLVLFTVVVKFLVLESDISFSWLTILKVILDAVIIAVAMLVTRLVALIYLKQ